MYSSIARWAVNVSSPLFRGGPGRHGTGTRAKFATLAALLDAHFEKHSEPNHICRTTLSQALEMLSGKPARIIETGSSAWGTKSSLLFDSYVNSFGGTFLSVDIRAEALFWLRPICTSKTTLFCDDSVHFLKNLSSTENSVDLLYLDSWDVDWCAPLPAAIHGFNEFMTIFPTLQNGGILLVDDTPRDPDVMNRIQPRFIADFEKFKRQYGFFPGKGALIKNFLQKNNLGKEICHDYQLLWRF
jgi:hypothetical protein